MRLFLGLCLCLCLCLCLHSYTTLAQPTVLSTSIWPIYFSPRFEATLAHAPHILNKDFCLFTADVRHVILASSRPAAQVPLHTFRASDDFL